MVESEFRVVNLGFPFLDPLAGGDASIRVGTIFFDGFGHGSGARDV